MYLLLKAAQPFALLLAPVLAVQGKGVRDSTPRLPEAAGPDHGVTEGEGPPVRLALLGDSTAAGVGAERHSEALPGFLAAALAERTGRAVAWRVSARSGAVARDVTRDHAPTLRDHPADLVVVLVGINDLLKLRRLRSWERDLTELVAAVRLAGPMKGPVPVMITGMPQVHRFPSLPQPLRAVMGLRALAMDHAVRKVVGRLPQTAHLRANAPDIGDTRFYATDRFHPSVEGYRSWAAQLAAPLAELSGGAAAH